MATTKHLMATEDNTEWYSTVKGAKADEPNFTEYEALSHNIGLRRVGLQRGEDILPTTASRLSLMGISAKAYDYQEGDAVMIVSPEFPHGKRIVLGEKTVEKTIMRQEPALKDKACISGYALDRVVPNSVRMPLSYDSRRHAFSSRERTVSAGTVIDDSPFKDQDGNAIGYSRRNAVQQVRTSNVEGDAFVSMHVKLADTSKRTRIYGAGNVSNIFKSYVEIGDGGVFIYGEKFECEVPEDWFVLTLQWVSHTEVIVYIGKEEVAQGSLVYSSYTTIAPGDEFICAQMEGYRGTFNPDVDYPKMISREDDEIVMFDISANGLTSTPTVAYSKFGNHMTVSTAVKEEDLGITFNELEEDSFNITSFFDVNSRDPQLDRLIIKYKAVPKDFRFLEFRIACNKFDIIWEGSAVKLISQKTEEE